MAAFNGKSTGPHMSEMYANRAPIVSAEQANELSIQAAGMRGKSVGAIKTNLLAGDYNDIQTIKQQELGNPTVDAFKRALANEMDPVNRAPSYMLETQEKSNLLMSDQDYHRGMKELMLDENTSPAIVKSQFRLRDLSASIREDAKNNSEGFMNKTGDFLKLVVPDWIFGGFIRDVMRSDEDLSKEIYRNSVGMTDEEWIQYAPVLREQAKERGVGTDNYFNQLEFADLIDIQGFDPHGQMNQALAVVFAIPTAVSGLRVARRVLTSSGKPITRVANEVGPVEAERVADEMLADPAAARRADVQEDLGPDVFNPSRTADEVRVGETYAEERFRRIMDGDSVMSVAIRENAQGAAGVSGREISQLASAASAKVRQAVGRPIARVNVYGPGMGRRADLEQGLSDYTVVMQMGRELDGSPLGKSQANAVSAKLRKDGVSAQTVPVDKLDESKGFFVEVQQKLDVSRVTSDIDIEGSLAGFGSIMRRVLRPLLSARSTTDEAFQTSALMGENVAKNLGQAHKRAQKSLKDLKGREAIRITDMVEDLRDGDNVKRSTWWSVDEFKAEYFKFYDKSPQPREIEAYLDLVDLNDTAWALKAEGMQIRLNNAGYVSLDYGDEFVPSKKINRRLTREDRVYDISGKRLLFGDEIDETMEVFEMWLPRATPLDNVNGPPFIKLVTKPKSRGIRPVAPHDAIPYNPGGTRRYKGENRFYVTVDGVSVIATAPSRKLAQQMSKGIDEIMDAARREGIDSFDGTGSRELDNIVAARTKDWMPEATTWEAFRATAKSKRWLFSKEKVSFKADNETIEGLAEDDFWSSSNFGDYVEATGSRSDVPLMAYGGNNAVTYNPIQAINMQLSDGITQFSHRGSTQRQMNDWLNMAGIKLEEGESVERAFHSARMDKMTKNPRTSYLKHTYQTIARRSGQAGPITTYVQQLTQDLLNSVLDMGGSKWARGAGGVLDTLSQDNFLRVGFLSAFVFNPAQFIVQASWVPGIIAISPKAGLKGAAVTMAVRAALHAPDEAAAILNLKKAMSVRKGWITPEQIEAVYRFQKRAGSDIIDAEALDKGTDAAAGVPMWKGSPTSSELTRDAVYGASKGVRRTEEIGMMFFNGGERMNRLTAHSTAVFEWIAENPTRKVSDIYDDLDLHNKLVTRADDLSGNMTTVSRGQWQSGIARVPTQWLSFSMRMLEFMTFGKQLKGAEKARLWTYFALIGGMTGFGLGAGEKIETVTKTLGFDPGSTGYTAIKTGLLDAMTTLALESITGEDFQTGLGPRLSPLPAILDFAAKISDGKFREVAAGPSGEIGGGLFMGMAGALHSMYNGDATMGWANLERAVRTPSFIDNPWKAIAMIKGEAYTSKTGTEVPLGMSPYEVGMVFLGLGSGKVNEWYSIAADSYAYKERLREVTKHAEKYQNRLYQALNDRDIDTATRVAEDLNTFLVASGLTLKDIWRVRKGLIDTGEPDKAVQMLLNAIKEGNDFEMQRLLAIS